MSLLRKIIFVLTCILSIYFIFIKNESSEFLLQQNASHHLNSSNTTLEFKQVNERKKTSELNLLQLIGVSSSVLTQEFGEPERKDLSVYGYTWWVYPNIDGYIQFGLDENDQIETIYARNRDIPIEEISDEQSYDQIHHVLSFENEVKYRNGLSSYTFYLTKEDLLERPLTHINDDVFIQFYFDKFTRSLSSYRILKADTLLKHIPYEVKYSGKLPEKPQLSDQQWEEIDRGMEQQIFDVTNIIRKENHLETVKWENDLHEVAFMHSKDMANHNYFSHDGPEGDGLKERLETKAVFYQSAGENIAAQYPDGLAAVEGWLNSQGHREALLDEAYTHLGVGVYRLYYTQNFIVIP